MKYKIIIEAIVEVPTNATLPNSRSPEGIADHMANLAITDTNINAESSQVIAIDEVINEED